MNGVELTQIIKNSLEKSISFDDYNHLVDQLVVEEKSSGPSQHEDLVYFTKLNAQRAKRLNKTIKVDKASTTRISGIKRKYTWLVLTESWCGDAAQILPLLNKLLEINPNIDLRLVFRDENDELMNEFLTNGGKSIPKLLILDKGREVLNTWGPRPVEAQALYDSWKNNPEKTPYREFQVDMQKWYLKDKGVSTFTEVSQIMSELEAQVLV
ncbi:MAG: thiol-disulfide isomerase/thioredoxin [Cyclobacteriaceae bacterium]|jgi:thiol-disulfide isomerase/thioredoxin